MIDQCQLIGQWKLGSELSGGSSGRARRALPPPPLILDQTEVRSAEKSFWDIGQLIISLHYLIAFINICLGSERESDKLSKGRVCL